MSVAHADGRPYTPRRLLCTPPPTPSPGRTPAAPNLCPDESCAASARPTSARSHTGAPRTTPLTRFRVLFPTTATDAAHDAWGEVVVPVSRPLFVVTVAEFVSACTTRIARAFPGLIRTCAVRCLAMAHPEWITGRPFQLPNLSPTPAAWVPAEHDTAVPCWHVDAEMNAQDTLDAFFSPALNAQDVRTYDLCLVWRPRRADDASPVLAAHDGVVDGEPLVRTAPKLTRAGVLPVVSMTPRATYVELLTARRGAAHDDDNDDSFGSVDSLLTSEAARGRHGARVAVCDAEAAARDDLAEQQIRAWTVMCDGAHDALRQLALVESLQETNSSHGPLAARLRRRCYPCDTEPLVHRPSTAERTRLTRDATQTAQLSHQYRAKVTAHYAGTAPQPHDAAPPAGFRAALAAAIAAERQAEHEAQVRQWYADAGLPVPEPEPVVVDKSHGAALPQEMLDDLLAHWEDNRRDLLRSERVSFRAMCRLMNEVCAKQRELDKLRVSRAYAEELAATDVLDAAAYAWDDAVTHTARVAPSSSTQNTATPTRATPPLAPLAVSQDDDDDDDGVRGARAREVTAVVEYLYRHAAMPAALRQQHRLLCVHEARRRGAVADEQATAWTALCDAHEAWLLRRRVTSMTLYV